MVITTLENPPEVRRSIQVTPIYERVADSLAETIVEVGGARSSKSYSVAQRIVELLTKVPNIRIGVCRKTFPALVVTAYELVVNILKEYGYYVEKWHNKTYHIYEHRPTRGKIYFFSVGIGDEERERIKSREFNVVWEEEANELTWDDHIYLRTRLSAPIDPEYRDVLPRNQIILTLNPTDSNCWIAQKLKESPDVQINHSNYKDNPFLSKEYVKSLKNLINEDYNYYRVLTLGEWGVLDNLIYPNWMEVPEIPEGHLAWAYGLDFGFTHPMALVKTVLRTDGIWLDEVVYKENMTNSQLIEHLTHCPKADIYADSAQPGYIREIEGAGWTVYPSEKYRGSVKEGIDLCKRHQIHVTSRSQNIIREIKNYQNKKDRNGNVLDEPVKFNDHGCDAFRYAVQGMVPRFGYPTATPGYDVSVPISYY